MPRSKQRGRKGKARGKPAEAVEEQPVAEVGKVDEPITLDGDNSDDDITEVPQLPAAQTSSAAAHGEEDTKATSSNAAESETMEIAAMAEGTDKEPAVLGTDETVPSTSKVTPVVDTMGRIEQQKRNDAKERAAALLAQMTKGSFGLSTMPSPTVGNGVAGDASKRAVDDEADDDQVTTKRQRLQESDADQLATSNEIAPEGPEEPPEEDDDVAGHKFGDTLDALPRIKVHTIETEERCLHEVAVPHNFDYKQLVMPDTEPAKTFEFQLDPFQKEAILCLDNNQSVLVSAHTSAGKTVVGLYAIALSLRDKQRVIYTTPIKALSNQKFRELTEEFEDVGLMTGDVTIKPDASVLVMTTEILRSMLYRGSEIMREVGWVVFDEIHYMRDKERGVVWEETIILLPDKTHYVFLSATIPNARQFAEWVCWLHDQPCHVVYTEHRPVPLQHFIYPAGGDGLYEVVSVEGKFKEDQFNKAMAHLQNPGGDGGQRRGTKGDANVTKIVRTLRERELLPMICFSFARKECEGLATGLKDMDFSDASDKKLINEIFRNAMEQLNPEDRHLPQIWDLLPYLEKGIGIHHSGLLPILKETIEILFGEGLIKCLFATETFSMGLNMPAKTVLFSSARKFDGKENRWLSSGEYVQMSGRAGRRGKDDKGLSILVVDQQMGADVAKQIVKGQPDPLNSQFRLTYNMVLNLLRVEGINPEFMLERSFYQFQNYAVLPQLYEKEKLAADKATRVHVDRELELTGYCQIEANIETLRAEMQKVVTKPQYLLPFLNTGRLAHIKKNGIDFGWGAILNYKRVQDNNLDPTKTQTLYQVDVCLSFGQSSLKQNKGDVNSLRPPEPGELGQMEVMSVLIDAIVEISAVRIKVAEDLKNFDKRQTVGRVIEEAKRRFKGKPGTPSGGLPLLDPIEDMGIKGQALKDIVQKLVKCEARLRNHPLKSDPLFDELYSKYQHKQKLDAEWRIARQELKKAKSLLQMDELKCRKRVLRRLGYCDNADVIQHKGRVACELSAGDELLLTELIFQGQFNTLSVQQCASLLSAFIFDEKNADDKPMDDELQGCFRELKKQATRIAQLQAECKLTIDEEEYVDKFKDSLMSVVHQWCSGIKFVDLLKTTNIFEGSIIRGLRRLEELLREMCCAAKSIGNEELLKRFEDARQRIKRDIVFAASLYL